MRRLVLDCCVSLAWVFEDEISVYAEKVLSALSKTEVVVPVLWPLEMANGLLVAERRKRISKIKLYQLIEVVGTFPITIDELTAKQAMGTTLHLAEQHGLSSYDAAYLELAIRLGVELATQDTKLKNAAIRCGVKIF